MIEGTSLPALAHQIDAESIAEQAAQNHTETDHIRAASRLVAGHEGQREGEAAERHLELGL